MKLSIITINWNNKAGLHNTINSILSQSYQDFEWIVIDGGSTDGSKELIEEYSDRITYWVSEKDSGIYNAMNKGVLNANGEYVQFLNSGDTFCDEHVLSDIIDELHTDDIIYGDIIFCKGEKHIEERQYADTFGLHTLLYSSLGHCSSFIKRELLVKAPYNESYKIVSDWEFFIKMAMTFRSFRHIKRFIGLFDAEGVSSSNSLNHAKERQDVINKYIPQCILSDYSSGRIGKLIMLRERHPHLGKIFTCLILTAEKILK